ncbi:hypothetical protein ACOBR2_07160 [Telmatobacter bradus]|uniref:hypothetical protein n=1 Tax=Telmatobacter bradus TaxID=474953 RepID=UPI003B4309E1
MKRTVLAFVLFAVSSMMALGQDSRRLMTNSDVLDMVKSGIGEQTIVLTIKQGSVKFDTSPQSLIELKKAGVGESVLDAMIAAMGAGEHPTVAVSPDTEARSLLQKAINAFGSRETIASISAIRSKSSEVRTTQGKTATLEWEKIRVFPNDSYMSGNTPGAEPYIQVVTHDTSYRRIGKNTSLVTGDDLASIREGMKFDLAYIAMHSDQFSVTYAGEEQLGNVAVRAIRLTLTGTQRDTVWKIDPQTGRILSAVDHSRSGDAVAEFSDFRTVSGLVYPFKRHVTAQGVTSDITITDYAVNPAIDAALFDRPGDLPADLLTIRVLQSQSVPYTQQLGNSANTNCSISGTANTFATANTAGNTTWGNGTTNSSMQMNCNSYDTTIRWPHMLNMMLIEASDGNAYIIECDKAWRWSKCVSLIAGQTFNARFTPKGIEVEAVTAKGQSIKPVYGIVQSRAMQQ